MLVPDSGMNKSPDHAKVGKFYGYAKSRALFHWIGVVANRVKHAHGARFLELDPTSEASTPGKCLLQLGIGESPSIIELPECVIDVRDRVHFETEHIEILGPLPKVGTDMGLQLAFDETYHLPYVMHLYSTTPFGQSFPSGYCKGGYILVVVDHDQITIEEVLTDFSSHQAAHISVSVSVWLVKSNSSQRTDIKEQFMMLHQVFIVPIPVPILPEAYSCRAVTSLYKPDCPQHI
jgi:hypothetical protein